MSRFLVSAAVLSLVAHPALAQTAPPPAGQTQGLGGPVVAGVCLLSREAIFANAKVGLAATARLEQLGAAAQAEVDAQRAPIDADIRTFQSDAAQLTAEQRVQREQALAARLQTVQTLAEQRNREIDATRQRALQTIAEQAQPVIREVYTQRNCGLLMDRNALLGGNFANDLTADVVAQLDTRVSTMTFERETLPPPAAAGAPRP